MAMSRKHYREAAEVIREQVEQVKRDDLGSIPTAVATDALRAVAAGLAVMFKADNSRFDRYKFMDACGL